MEPEGASDRMDLISMREALGKCRTRWDHGMGMGVCSEQPRCSSKTVLRLLRQDLQNPQGFGVVLAAIATPQVTSRDRQGQGRDPLSSKCRSLRISQFRSGNSIEFFHWNLAVQSIQGVHCKHRWLVMMTCSIESLFKWNKNENSDRLRQSAGTRHPRNKNDTGVAK